jgi:uncharacterized protein (TIGR04255 family)
VPEIVDDENERVLAKLLEDDYPVRGLVQGVVLPLPGMSTPPTPEHFRTFEDTEGLWKATVAPDFIALETSRYASRKDFLARLERLLSARGQVKAPPRVTRVGIRYTDRIENPQGLVEIVHPSLLGFLPELTEPDESLSNQVVQALLSDPSTGAQVQVRSLCLPPGLLFDSSIPPVPVQSWVLDIDSFNESPTAFEASALTDIVSTLAERAYQVFYWSVTDRFRDEFGAQGGDAIDG